MPRSYEQAHIAVVVEQQFLQVVLVVVCSIQAVSATLGRRGSWYDREREKELGGKNAQLDETMRSMAGMALCRITTASSVLVTAATHSILPSALRA
jgi:hypothetical protein